MADITPGSPTQAGSQKDYTSGLGVPQNEGTPSWVTGTVTNILDQSIKFTDQQIQANQQATIREDKETIDQSVRESQFDYIKDRAMVEGGYLPQGVKDKQEALDRLENAYKNGALSESNYYSRLDAVSRELRSRYPGYKDEIDTYMSRLAGTNPANAVVKDIIGRMHKSKDPDRSDALHTERGLIAFGFQPPSNMPLDQQKAMLAQYHKAKLDRDEAKNSLNFAQDKLKYDKDVDTATTEKLDRAVTTSMSADIQAILSPIINSTTNNGVVSKSIVEQLEEHKRNGTSPPQQLVGNLDAAASRIRSEMTKAGLKFVNSMEGRPTSEQRASILSRFNEEGERYASMLTKGEWSGLATVKQHNEMTIQYGQAAAFNRSSILKSTAVIDSLFKGGAGKTIEGIFTRTEGDKGTTARSMFEDEVKKEIQLGFGASSTPGEATTLDTIKRQAEMQGLDPAKIIVDTVKGSQKVVTSKDVPDQLKVKYVEALAGNKMDTFSAQFTTTAGRREALMLYTDPATLAEVRRLDKTNPGLVDKHNQTILRNGIVTLESGIVDIKKFAESDMYTTRIAYDANKGEFKEEPNPNFKKLPSANVPVSGYQAVTPMRNYVTSLNLTLDRLGKGLIGPGEAGYKIEKLNEIVANTGFRFTPMSRPETVDKKLTDKLPTP